MTKPEVIRIDVHELKTRMEQAPGLCLVDVRGPNEWREIHIPGAIHLPLSEIDSADPSRMPDAAQPVYLLCRGGVRSLHAAELLLERGYQEVYSIDGGILEWSMFGYPVASL